tara:strand:- start:15198 stop:16088 length:891 start_codon:yes stop_codon:yes gene_type:complete
MERLLLIGGTGHLGYAIINEICNFWQDKEIFITVLTRNNNLPTYFPKEDILDFKRYDPQNISTIKDYIENIKPTKVIYLASDNKNNDSADLYVSSEVNLFIPIKILFLIKEIDVNIKYIFLSSKLSNLEDNEYCLYSLNKYFAEEYIQKFSDRFNINSTSIKLPTLFGPGDFSKKRLISNYIQCLLKNKKSFIKDDLQKKITIVSSRMIARILLKKILENDKDNFSKLIESFQFKISIGDLLKILDFIHSSNSISNSLLNSIKFIENFKDIEDYELLYYELSKTYNFLNKNIYLIS